MSTEAQEVIKMAQDLGPLYSQEQYIFAAAFALAHRDARSRTDAHRCALEAVRLYREPLL